MTIQRANLGHYDAVLNLYVDCFKDNEWFLKHFGTEKDLAEVIRNDLSPAIRYCIMDGISYVIYDDKILVGFVLGTSYSDLGSYAKELIFGDEVSLAEEVCNYCKILDTFKDKVYYLMAIGVAPNYRRQGYATTLLNHLLSRIPHPIVSCDVVEEFTLPMYAKLGFTSKELAVGYYFECLKRTHVDGFPIVFKSYKLCKIVQAPMGLSLIYENFAFSVKLRYWRETYKSDLAKCALKCSDCKVEISKKLPAFLEVSWYSGEFLINDILLNPIYEGEIPETIKKLQNTQSALAEIKELCETIFPSKYLVME